MHTANFGQLPATEDARIRAESTPKGRPFAWIVFKIGDDSLKAFYADAAMAQAIWPNESPEWAALQIGYYWMENNLDSSWLPLADGPYLSTTAAIEAAAEVWG